MRTNPQHLDTADLHPACDDATRHAAPVPTPRVLLLADSYWPIVGGGETHARLVAATLHMMGVPVRVLTQLRVDDSPVTETLDGVRIDRVGYPGHKRFGKYMMMPGMMKWLVDHRDEFDVIYSCGLRVLGLPAVLAGKALRKPVVLRSESCEELSGKHILDHLEGGKRALWPVIRVILEVRNAVLRRAEAFMAISTAVQREYASCYVPSRRVHKVYNGIDLSVYRSGVTPEEKRALRERLNLPTDATLATYTGKLNKGKGLEHLLAAMKRLAPVRPDLHVVLVGAGGHMYLSLEEALKRYVSEHGLSDRVTFTGYQTNVADYLRASDLFVMPSEMEALCISLIEALACGLPSVACDVGGIPDVARHEREALLVPPADADALADAIERLLDDSAFADSLAEQGKMRMAEVFDIRTVADQHRALFEHVRFGDVEGGAIRVD